MSNFTLHVVAGSDLAPRILRLRLEYFVAAAVAVIAVLLLVTVAVAAMLVRVCRRKAKREKQERVSYILGPKLLLAMGCVKLSEKNCVHLPSVGEQTAN